MSSKGKELNMAAPIGITPILRGKEADEWWEKVNKEKANKLSLVETPDLEKLRQELVTNAQTRKK